MRKILYILLNLPLFAFGQVQDSCYSITDFMSQTETVNPAITKNFTAGWNMFGYPCTQSLDLVEALSSIIDKVIIVKNNNGSVYMPEFGFNGIGNLESGEGYQIKLSDTEYGFSFCESINWPDIEGCTDCEAPNFDPFAVTDNGTCEVLGCLNNTACNFNPDADIADGNCEFPEQGYDCDGNITAQIGDVIEGGILFYIDESNERGLVSMVEDYGEYNWGECNEVSIDGAYGEYIGTGYKNTYDIADVCVSGNTANAIAVCLSYEGGGYDDWFLPSKYELMEMYLNISQVSSLGDVGNFNNNQYWSSSIPDLGNNDAWSLGFSSGNFDYTDKSIILMVRPIRAFGNWTMGCIDSLACNYNPEANMADASCEYTELGYDCEGNISEYVIGMQAEGGIVFYVDETGQHGLVAAMEDLEGSYEWGCEGVDVNGADGHSIGTGLQNTLDIVAGCSETPIAASVALTYVNEGYSDWYLPSRYELAEMYNTIRDCCYDDNIEGWGSVWHWSSSEANYTNYAWNFSFHYNLEDGNYKDNTYRVRVIRDF